MPRRGEILESGIGVGPLPDETLFSWCSRYHRLAANGLDRTTCLQLFGHRYIGSAHDLPARIDALVVRSKGSLGTAGEIIQERTLLPFYLPFRPLGLAEQAVAALRGNGIGSLKYRLGLLTSGLGAAHPLKACPDCMERDRQDTGWAYWHRHHQLPGVWACLQHRVPLLVTHLKVDQVARFAWVLPIPARCQPVAPPSARAEALATDDWLLRLASASAELTLAAPGSLADPTRTANALKRRMADMGLTYASGRVRWREAESWLDRLASNLACMPGLNQEAGKSLLQSQLLRLLSARSLAHPLRYLIWISMWFDGLRDFQSEYERVDTTLSEPAVGEFTRPAEYPAARLGRMPASTEMAVRSGKLSLTAAAKRSGVSYATMAAWACRASLEPPRRPKKLDEPLWTRALRMLQEGADKELVAQACQVSVVTVTRILRTVPGLQDHWHRVRQERCRATARTAWNNILELSPYLGLKALRQLEPAAYAWLYRNDREWLRSFSDSITKAPATNHALARMRGADTRMAAALRGIVLSGNLTSVPRSLADMKRALPALRRALRRPEQWPLTVQVMGLVATGRRSERPLLDHAVARGADFGR